MSHQRLNNKIAQSALDDLNRINFKSLAATTYISLPVGLSAGYLTHLCLGTNEPIKRVLGSPMMFGSVAGFWLSFTVGLGIVNLSLSHSKKIKAAITTLLEEAERGRVIIHPSPLTPTDKKLTWKIYDPNENMENPNAGVAVPPFIGRLYKRNFISTHVPHTPFPNTPPSE